MLAGELICIPGAGQQCHTVINVESAPALAVKILVRAITRSTARGLTGDETTVRQMVVLVSQMAVVVDLFLCWL